MAAIEAADARTARASVTEFARLVGAPAVHASLCGEVSCPWPGMPGRYRGVYEGPTAICDPDGHVLAERRASEGPGTVVAEVAPGSSAPLERPADGFWLRSRGPVGALAWGYQGWHGRRDYACRD